MTRRHPVPRAVLFSTLVAVAVLGARSVHADDAACIAASEEGLSLRRAGKLHDALAQLATCAAPTCPDEVKAECASRITDVKRAMPTLILVATDPAGKDLRDVRVSLDGAPLVSSLDGRPVAIDPGSHTLRFEQAGQAPVEKSLVVREGEKDRRESIVIGPPPAPVVTAPVAPPPVEQLSFWTTQRILAVASAGVGVGGVVVGAIFGGLALSDKNQEQSNCTNGACPNRPQAQEDYDTGRTNATVSTIGFVAGAVLIAAGAVLFFTARSPAASASRGIYLAPASAGRGSGLVLGGSL